MSSSRLWVKPHRHVRENDDIGAVEPEPIAIGKLALGTMLPWVLGSGLGLIVLVLVCWPGAPRLTVGMPLGCPWWGSWSVGWRLRFVQALLFFCCAWSLPCGRAVVLLRFARPSPCLPGALALERRVAVLPPVCGCRLAACPCPVFWLLAACMVSRAILDAS